MYYYRYIEKETINIPYSQTEEMDRERRCEKK